MAIAASGAQATAVVRPVSATIRPDELVQQRVRAEAADRANVAEKKAAQKKAAAKKKAGREKAAEAREVDAAYADAYAKAFAAASRSAALRTAQTTAAVGASSLPVHGARVTAVFGQVGSLWTTIHTGVDLACPEGTPVLAAAAGTVVSAQDDGVYGLRIRIRHPDGTETRYGHLSTFLIASGQVRAGQVIGLSGNTGKSSGPHLHFEVRVRGVAIDPQAWLRARGLYI